MIGVDAHTDRVGEKETQAQSHCSRDVPRMSRCCAHVAKLSVEVGVEVVLLAELVRERDAGEQLAPLALDRVDVEEHNEPREEPHEHHQEDDDLTALAVQVHAAEADVRQKGEGQEEAGDEAGDVGKIVDPGQQTEGKEEKHHAQQLGEGPPGLGEDLPALKELHKQAGENPELRAGWTHLRRTGGTHLQLQPQRDFTGNCNSTAEVSWGLGDHLSSVGKKDGRGQVARDATDDVNDGDPQPARQFLQVPQDGHLKRHRHQAVKDPGRTETEMETALIRAKCVARGQNPARVGEIIPSTSTDLHVAVA